MPEPFTTYKNNVAAAWLWVASDVDFCYQAAYNMAVHLNTEGNPNSSTEAYNLATGLWNLKAHISGGSPSMRITTAYCLNWIDDNWPENGAELTMTKLMETMWTAKPWQCLLFVPMVDAMRGAIMNKTVTEEWMSMAMRHFEQ